MVNAGRILILAKGNWSNLVNYEQLDLVTKGDIAYLARQASVGVDPSTDTQMTYWQPFGSAAKIADTTTPGLVMPDGTTITIDINTGLIQANLNVSDLKDVALVSLASDQILKYNATTQKWDNYSISDIQTPIESMIAPLENGTTTSQAYAAGEKFVRNNVLYEALVPISQGASFASLALNTDYKESDAISKLFDELAAVAKSGSYNDLSDKPTIPAATSISSTGTASATGVRYQRVGIGTVYTEIDGTKYMEQTQTLSTSGDTTFTFTNAAIAADSVIQPFGSIFGIVPSNITTSAGSCVVTIPKHDTAVSLKVRIYIR